MRTAHYIFIALLASSLLSPWALKLTGSRTEKLGGVTKADKKTSLNIKSFIDGKFQAHFEKRFPKQFPIFGPLVKSDNQLSLWLFKQISSNPNSKVVLGNKGHLIERSYLTAFNRLNVPKRSRVDKLGAQLGKLDKLLRERGKVLIVLISTNKPSFYPELVPSWYAIADAQNRPSGRDFFFEATKARGLNIFDTKEFLRSVETETKIPMFAPTGTHWNQFASCRIVKELQIQVETKLAKRVPQLDCEIKGNRKAPRDQDKDLLGIANLMFPKSLIAPAPLVISKVRKADDAVKPKLLLVGTSFSGELMDTLNSNPALADREFLYYFKRQIIPRDRTNASFKPKKFDVEAAIARNDVVILEANEATIHRLGYGFIQRALEGRF